MDGGLPIVNLDEARFECTFGRGCDGVCCKEGRPLVYPDEVGRIAEALEKLQVEAPPRGPGGRGEEGVPQRPASPGPPRPAQRRRLVPVLPRGMPPAPTRAGGRGQVPVQAGRLLLFPIQQDEHDRWYIRQRGFHRETWDLFCLDPRIHPRPAAETLVEEIALAKRFDDEAKAATPRPGPG